MIEDILKLSSSLSDKNIDEIEFRKFLKNYDIEDNIYIELMLEKNGLICFESALHIYPHADNITPNLKLWNDQETWKKEYNFIDRLYLCFAQDLFGFQFCFTSKGIELFDPETGEFSYLTHNFDSWIKTVLEDYNYYTGYEIGHEWQKKFGALKSSERLIGKIPFVLGGKYSIENLYSSDIIEVMKFRANLANQIYCLEDGQQVILKDI